MKRKALLLLIPFAVAGLAGCQSADPGNPPVDQCDQAEITLNKTEATLKVGESVVLEATAPEACGDLGWGVNEAGESVVHLEKDGKTCTVTATSVGTAIVGYGTTASCTITVEGDDPGPITDYGTEDNPITITKAAAILAAECVEDGDLTKQAITAIGTVKNIRSVQHYQEDIGPDCFELDLTDGTSDVYVYRLHATAEVGANIALNSTVKFVGFGKNFKGTLEFVDNGKVKCTALSAVKSTKTVVSLSDIVGPSEVALNGQVALTEVSMTLHYDDGTTLEGQHPDRIVLEKEFTKEEWSHEAFLNALPDTDCRYVLLDYEYTTGDGIISDCVFFILYNPLVCKANVRFRYTSGKGSIEGAYPSIAKTLQVDNKNDLTDEKLKNPNYRANNWGSYYDSKKIKSNGKASSEFLFLIHQI